MTNPTAAGGNQVAFWEGFYADSKDELGEGEENILGIGSSMGEGLEVRGHCTIQGTSKSSPRLEQGERSRQSRTGWHSVCWPRWLLTARKSHLR